MCGLDGVSVSSHPWILCIKTKVGVLEFRLFVDGVVEGREPTTKTSRVDTRQKNMCHLFLQRRMHCIFYNADHWDLGDRKRYEVG